MKLLAIDTSSPIASFALSTGKERFNRFKEGVREHAKQILPIVDELLTDANLGIEELDGVVFGRGPGSFTGLRVACSVAKGLAYSRDLKLYPVSSLAAIAHKAFQLTENLNDHHCLAMMDARMEQVYWGTFSKEHFDAEEKVSSPQDIELNGKENYILAGVGFESYRALLSDSINNQIKKDLVIYPDAQSMIELVESGYIKPVHAIDAMPTYIRNQVTHGGKNG